MAESKKKKRASRKQIAALKKAREAKARKRIERQIEAEKGPPDLEGKIRNFAAAGGELEDIVSHLKIADRMSDHGFRSWVEKLVEEGHSNLRLKLAVKLTQEASEGKVTALREMAEAWLSRFQAEAPALEFARGYEDRLNALIEKARERQQKKKRGEL